MLLFLHGFAGTPSAWDDVLAAWPGGAPAFRAPAIPVAPTWDATLDALAAPGDAVAVGYSMGARLALGLLARDAVRAAVLISVNPGIDDAERAARRAADARWAALLRAHGTRAFLDAWEAQPMFAGAPHGRRRTAREALDPERLARQLETIGLAEMPDHRDALAARAGRAHLVVGERDTKFVSLASAAAARSPELVVEVLPRVGHDPTLEAPAELATRLARAVARWPGCV